jgi:uncharacterized membrane protein YgdD (TMEM256/DUF423 family)
MVRTLIVLGALSGFLGVALSAMARHATGAAYLQTVAQFLLFHAPAFLSLAALIGTGLVHERTGTIAGVALLLGLALFCGDLAARDFLSRPLFPWAAPTGGFALMAGWLLILVAALLRRG